MSIQRLIVNKRKYIKCADRDLAAVRTEVKEDQRGRPRTKEDAGLVNAATSEAISTYYHMSQREIDRAVSNVASAVELTYDEAVALVQGWDR